MTTSIGAGLAPVKPLPPRCRADLQALLEVVRAEGKLLRKYGEHLAGGVERRFEEHVGAVGIGEENLVRPVDRAAQAVAVARARLDVASASLAPRVSPAGSGRSSGFSVPAFCRARSLIVCRALPSSTSTSVMPSNAS